MQTHYVSRQEWQGAGIQQALRLLPSASPFNNYFFLLRVVLVATALPARDRAVAPFDQVVTPCGSAVGGL
jgi:hypothetical protein